MKVKRLASFILCTLMLLGMLAACSTDNSGRDPDNGGDALADSGNTNTGGEENQNTPSDGEEDPNGSDSGNDEQNPDPEDGQLQYAQLVAKVSGIEDGGVYTLTGYDSEADYETLDWAQFDIASFTEGTQIYQMLPDTDCKFYTYNDAGEAIEAAADDITPDCMLRIQYGSNAQDENTQADTLYIVAYEIYILPTGGDAA